MITLITGTPGAGKTLYTVANIIKPAAEEGRPVFTMGIPELALPHVETPPINQWTMLRDSEEEPGLKLPYFDFPENSIIVLDECQRVYRTRPNGSQVPAHVAAFETHRHTGVDFVLITQNPQLVDAHVRKLVGRHIHLRDVGVLGRWFYEWPECTDVSQFKSAPVKKRYRLPKSAYGLYKSASLHIKPTRSIPPVVYMLGLALVAAVVLGFQSWHVVSDKFAKKDVSPAKVAQVSAAPAGDAIEVKKGDPLTEFIPVVPDRPETAPAYDQLRVVKEMPQISGCIKHDDGCNCYTQQGTKAPVSFEYCAAWMKGNRPFNPYRDPPQAAQPDPPPPPRSNGPQVVRGDGPPPVWLQDRNPSPADKTAAAPAITPQQAM